MSDKGVKITSEDDRPLTISLPVENLIERPFNAMRQAATEIGDIYNSATGTNFIKEPHQVPYKVFEGFRDVYVTLRNRGEELDADSLGRFLGTLIEFRKSMSRRSTERISPGMLSRSFELFLRQRPGITRGEAENAQGVLNDTHRVAGKALEAIGASPARAAALTMRRYILEGQATDLHPRDHGTATRLSSLLALVSVNIHPAHVPMELIHGFLKICELCTKHYREGMEWIKFRTLSDESLSRLEKLIKRHKRAEWVDPTELSGRYEEYLRWTYEIGHRDNLSEPIRNKLDEYHNKVLSALKSMGVDVELPTEPKPAIGENGYAFTLNVEPLPQKKAFLPSNLLESWVDFLAGAMKGGVEVPVIDNEILLQDVYRVARLDPGKVSEKTVASFTRVFSEQMGKHAYNFAFPHTLMFLEYIIRSKAEGAKRRIGPKEIRQEYAAALRAIAAARIDRARAYAEIDESRASEALPVIEAQAAAASPAAKTVAASTVSVWDHVPFAMGEALSSPISKSPGVVPSAGALGEAFWDGRVPEFSITGRRFGPGDTVVSKSNSDFISDKSLRRTRIIYLAGGLYRSKVTDDNVKAFLSVFVSRTKSHEQSANNFADTLRFFASLIAKEREKTRTTFGVNRLLKEYAQTLDAISAVGIDRAMVVAGIRKPEPFAVEEVAALRAQVDQAAREQTWGPSNVFTRAYERFANRFLRGTPELDSTVVARANAELSYAILTGQVRVKVEESGRSKATPEGHRSGGEQAAASAAASQVVNHVPFSMGEALSDLTVVGKRAYPDVEGGLGRATAEFYTIPSTKKSDKGGTPGGTGPRGIDPRLAGAELLVAPPELSLGSFDRENDKAPAGGSNYGIWGNWTQRMRAAAARRRARRKRAAQSPGAVPTPGVYPVGTSPAAQVKSLPVVRPPALLGH
jgi:hypothetical protein